MENKKKFYSKELDDTCVKIGENGTAIFESGVFYTPAELRIIQGSNIDMMATVHKIKKIFPGTEVIK
jgi:hypothetical protein